MPTFSKSTQQAITLTEKELTPHWNSTVNAYRQAMAGIDSELQKVYAKYLSSADPADYYNIMIQYDRLTKLQKAVGAEYQAAAIKAGKETAVSSQLAMTNTFYRNQYNITWVQPEAMAFVFIDPDFVSAAVTGTEASWRAIKDKDTYGNPQQYLRPSGTLSEMLRKNRDTDLRRLNETIVAGLRQGKSYSAMVSDVRDIIGRERVKDGVRQLTGSKYNAMRILRTEGTRTLNDGFLAALNDAQNQGVDVQKVWDATLDMKTRSSHGSADGQVADLDGLFNVNGATGTGPGNLSRAGENINCRCSIGTKIPGIDDGLRVGINPATGEREVINYTTFDTWAADNGLRRNRAGVLVQS